MYEHYKNFYGPPETARDYIFVAAKELHQGNWKRCYELLMNVNIWHRLPSDSEKIKQNLRDSVKEQAFKCYLYTFQNSYESIDLDQLAQRFDLGMDYIRSYISKMVFNRELHAYLDNDSNCLIFEKDQTTKIENLALGLADKVNHLVISNEKIMDSKYGNYGFSDKDIEGFKKKKQPKNKLNVINKDKRRHGKIRKDVKKRHH
mmetsp:Transcript_17957/g.15684  ORF Transcript_17957/g.15684 Transcript_17957/m.15684 type:complete len:203 (-) Transcript_17957:358-966(-)